jgi:hypothetical protein
MDSRLLCTDNTDGSKLFFYKKVFFFWMTTQHNNTLIFIPPLGMLSDTPEALKELVGHDYKNQLSFIEGMRAVVGQEREGWKIHQHLKGKFPKNVTTVQFLIWAYGVSYATFKRWKGEEFKWTKKVAAHAGKSLLTDSAFAQKIYTPKRMFITAKMAEWYESQRVQSHRVDTQAKRNKRLCLKTA